MAPKPSGSNHHDSKPVPTTRTSTGITFGGRGKPMEIGQAKRHAQEQGLCYRCGKQGHYSRNCPDGVARAIRVLEMMTPHDCYSLSLAQNQLSEQDYHDPTNDLEIPDFGELAQ